MIKNTKPLLVLMLACFVFSGCQWGDHRGHNLFRGTRAHDSAQTVNVEEIRGSNGQEVLGYLEEELYKPEGTTGKRTIYYIYDQNYESIEGYITDTGEVTKIIQRNKEKPLGPLGINKGVRRILGYSGSVQFYREGGQVYH